jgi:hypothetical protein
MRGPFVAAAVLAALALAPGEPARAEAGGYSIVRASVRFAKDGAGRLRLDGVLTATGALAALGAAEPLAGDLRLALGPAGLLEEGGLPDGARLRSYRDGSWELDVRRAFDGRGRFRLRVQPAGGGFVARARGFDGAALRSAGPASVAVAFGAASDVRETAIDFEERSKDHWEYRLVLPPRPPPGGGGGGGGGGGTPGPINATTIAQGSASGITSFRFEVVKDQASWQTLWQAHAGGGSPPAVDFSAETVIGLWLGNRPTGGYTASILFVTPANIIGAPCDQFGCPPMGASVSWLESQPGGSCAVPQAVTQPFHIVRTPRIDGPVMAEGMTRVDDCF